MAIVPIGSYFGSINWLYGGECGLGQDHELGRALVG
jgi:hypothetical protein